MDKVNLNELKKQAFKEISKTRRLYDLYQIKSQWLGKKGKIKELLKLIPKLSVEEKKIFGAEVNKIKKEIEKSVKEREEFIKFHEVVEEEIDITLSGRRNWIGRIHPITRMIEEVVEVLIGMGFKEAITPEIESEWYNFDALNIPWYHPSRDSMASFFVNNGLLRTHTSTSQIRIMEKQKPPLRYVVHGKAYRFDAFDASHSPMFHQIEAFYVDRGVSFAQLKGTIVYFIREIFGDKINVKFFPSYFPFTEPSAEVYTTCIFCAGKGCNVCKGAGYIEVMGAGMIHPNVLKNVKIDPVKYTGFALGLGVERFAMLKYNINDIRLFSQNNLRFLSTV